MSRLPGQMIRDLGVFNPCHERTVDPHSGFSYGLGPSSYDIRVAEDIVIYPLTPSWCQRISLWWQGKKPKGFTLASSVEYFQMPTDVSADVKSKSSWARLGLGVDNTYIDPGWCGYLTLELFNRTNKPIVIRAGTPIAQIIFDKLAAPAEKPYTGKYQNQEAGAQATRVEKT